MKRFYLIFAIVLCLITGTFVCANLAFDSGSDQSGRPYRVEISRLCRQIEKSGEIPDISDCEYVTSITLSDGSEDLYSSDNDNLIRQIGSKLYRFDYKPVQTDSSGRLVMNVSIAVVAAAAVLLLIYVRIRLLKPFNRLSKVPYELSKGNLSTPIEEHKSRYFGKFIWGVNMLRDNIIDRREHELELMKEKQTLILSISHDIRTPLSAIKLYANGLSKGIYNDEEKISNAAKHINSNADDIDSFVTQLTRSASEDLIKLDVKQSEFYISEVINTINNNYDLRLADNSTEFTIESFRDCIVNGDPERAVEVLQNLLENAIKYGDGRYIRITFSQEENCLLVCVTNSGCTLPEGEMIHIFDSFWRGSNTANKSGSGLGLYICRQLMLKMDGEIFAEKKGDEMRITAVFRKA